ncbi:MAG: AraC family transcriptional regulator [Steroidobacteraceae bacterium]
MKNDEHFSHTTPNDLSVVAAQLVEAARKARDGDRDAARAHIAHAVALLHGKPGFGPSVSHEPPRAGWQVARGGLAAWQARRVVAHVEANVDRRITVQELAQLLGLSASHFCRGFKCSFGASPHTYVLHRRIEVAQGLMLTTCEPLSSIALSCGMCDHPHFTRAFHRIVGETPDAWRRSRRSALEDGADISERRVARVLEQQTCTSQCGQPTSPLEAGHLSSGYALRG